jgi:glycine/D-amino acid oxidase-like deaminating enzyme
LHRAALVRHGIAVESYDGSLGRGLYLPDDAAMNPARRAIGLTALLSRRAPLHEHTRVLEVRAGKVRTEHGTVTAPVVIVAIDGRLDVLLPQLTGRVRTARLQMLATAPIAAARLHCPVYGRWGYDYAQQSEDRRLFVGGGRDRFEAAEWTTDASPTGAVQGYIEHLAARFAAAPVSVTHRWAASVGFTGGDGRALCCAVDDGVIAIGGYNGTGNLVGPVAARAAAALALDGSPPPACFAS